MITTIGLKSCLQVRGHPTLLCTCITLLSDHIELTWQEKTGLIIIVHIKFYHFLELNDSNHLKNFTRQEF